MAKKSACPISRAEFRKHAKPLPVKIGEKEFQAVVKEFSTGSLGWNVNEKLTVEIDGKHVTVPALIGIYANGDPSQGGFFVELHTHDATGIMHLESPKDGAFTLGQFFGVWGVRLSQSCIGGYCATATNPLRFFVNGKRYIGNPNNIVLKNHQEFAIVYGKPPAKIPSSYNWGPSGL